ncbi:MAG TPA: hypothetical protein VFK88_13375 [Gallionella sp.]|nr:hypothetical protein [Gallionella sp.]
MEISGVMSKLGLMHPEIKKHFAVAAMASGFLLLITAFRWLFLANTLLSLLYIPLIATAWLLWAGAITFGVTCLSRYRTAGLYVFAPLAISVFGMVLVKVVPFTEMWLKTDYSWYKNDRAEIVNKILRGELKSNVSHNARLIALGEHYPLVSKGGNEVVVEEHDGAKYVLFFTERGIFGYYEGFLYVSKEGDPIKYGDLSEKDRTEIQPLEVGWYYVLHR